MMGKEGRKKSEAPPRFELGISCLLDRRFNQLSHGATASLHCFSLTCMYAGFPREHMKKTK